MHTAAVLTATSATATPVTALVKAEPPAPPRLFEAAHDFDPMDWASVRGQFKLDPALAHLSNFYLASYPKPVRDAIDYYRDALDRDPHSFLNDNMFAQPEQALWRRVAETVARYTGGGFDAIAFTGNTTLGLSLVYNGIVLRPGQEILTTTHEFFPHYEAIRLAAARSGATFRQVSLYEDSARASVGEMVERLVGAVQPHTRVLAVTWVHSNFGVVLPVTAVSAALAAVNRERAADDQVLLVVDGVHGFGALDENVAAMGCDFFAAGTHKWMLGPHGSGIVWGKPSSWARLRPIVPSLMTREPANAWREARAPVGPVQAAWFSPGGFLAYEHIWAIAEAFRFHERIGRARIAERILELNGALKDGLAAMSHVRLLSPRARELSAGFVCFDVEGIAPREVALRLRQAGVIANATPYGRSCARFSAGIVNSEADIERALATVRAMR